MNFFAWIHSRYYTLQVKPKILNTAASVQYLYFDVLLQRRQQSCQFSFDAGCRIIEDNTVSLDFVKPSAPNNNRSRTCWSLDDATYNVHKGALLEQQTPAIAIMKLECCISWLMMLFFHFTIFYIVLSCLFNHSCNTRDSLHDITPCSCYFLKLSKELNQIADLNLIPCLSI